MECIENKKMSFPLGMVFTTYRVNLASDSDVNFRKELWEILNRFRTCEFGLTENEDRLKNLTAIRVRRGQVVAKYGTSHGEAFIITDFDIRNGQDWVTTVLFVDEY